MTIPTIILLVAALFLVPAGFRLVACLDAGLAVPSSVVVALLPAAVLLVAACRLNPGPAAGVLAAPWLAVTAAAAMSVGIRRLREPLVLRPDPGMAVVAACFFLTVGSVFAVIDRLGFQPFGFAPTIILLTAVHFTYAGFVLVLAGALAYRRWPRRVVPISIGAVVVGIPLTAIGFFGVPLADWSGAVLTATGGLGIGCATIVAAPTLAGRAAPTLAVVAGVSLLLAMPLAVAYATAPALGFGAIDIDTMARVHGSLNAFGFAVAAMAAWTIDRRATAIRTVTPAGKRSVAVPLALTGLISAALGALIAGPITGAAGVVATGVAIALAGAPAARP